MRAEASHSCAWRLLLPAPMPANVSWVGPRQADGPSLLGILIGANRGVVDRQALLTTLTMRRHTPSYMRERGGASPSGFLPSRRHPLLEVSRGACQGGQALHLRYSLANARPVVASIPTHAGNQRARALDGRQVWVKT